MKTYKHSVRSVLIKMLSSDNSLMSNKDGIKLLKETVEETWKPKENEVYFYINGTANVSDSKWDDVVVDDKRLEFGNCFRTRVEAQTKAEQVRKLLKNI